MIFKKYGSFIKGNLPYVSKINNLYLTEPFARTGYLQLIEQLCKVLIICTIC